MAVTVDLSSLYAIDDQEWLAVTIELLRSQRLDALDLEHLIEELEDLGNERRSAVESLLEQVIRHCLLCEYWQVEAERNGNHWRAEIVGFRSQLKRRLTTNLKNHLGLKLPDIYQSALEYVRQKTGLTVDFPEDCPYTLEQLLALNWLP